MNADYGEPQAPRKETKRICTLTSMRSIATNRHIDINTDRDMCTIIVCVCIYTIILYMQEANIKYCATMQMTRTTPCASIWTGGSFIGLLFLAIWKILITPLFLGLKSLFVLVAYLPYK